MNKQNFENQSRFPLSTKSLTFMQEMINVAAYLSAIGGDNYILSGCSVSGSNVSDGIIVLEGEIMPLVGGVIANTITVVEDAENVTANGIEFEAVRVRRYAKFASGVGDNYFSWAKFKVLPTNQELEEKKDDKGVTTALGFVVVGKTVAQVKSELISYPSDVYSAAREISMICTAGFRDFITNIEDDSHTVVTDSSYGHITKKGNGSNHISFIFEEIDAKKLYSIFCRNGVWSVSNILTNNNLKLGGTNLLNNSKRRSGTTTSYYYNVFDSLIIEHPDDSPYIYSAINTGTSPIKLLLRYVLSNGTDSGDVVSDVIPVGEKGSFLLENVGEIARFSIIGIYVGSGDYVNDSIGDFSLSDIKLERGNIVTDWSSSNDNYYKQVIFNGTIAASATQTLLGNLGIDNQYSYRYEISGEIYNTDYTQIFTIPYIETSTYVSVIVDDSTGVPVVKLRHTTTFGGWKYSMKVRIYKK